MRFVAGCILLVAGVAVANVAREVIETYTESANAGWAALIAVSILAGWMIPGATRP